MKDEGLFSDVWLLYLNSDCQTLKEKIETTIVRQKTENVLSP